MSRQELRNRHPRYSSAPHRSNHPTRRTFDALPLAKIAAAIIGAVLILGLLGLHP